MMASSSCMPAGRRPCARSSATAGFKPAFSARRWCAYHSYCAVQWRAVTRIANSFRRAGSELRNRICSPHCRSRSASAGLRRYTLNGLPMVPAPGTTAALPVAATGPDMTAFAYARCAGVISLNGVSLKRRMSSCAHALPASKASPKNSNPTVRIFIWRSPWRLLASHRFGTSAKSLAELVDVLSRDKLASAVAATGEDPDTLLNRYVNWHKLTCRRPLRTCGFSNCHFGNAATGGGTRADLGLPGCRRKPIAQRAAALGAIDMKAAVERCDVRDTERICEPEQTGVGEVHGAIGVFLHQRGERGQLLLRYVHQCKIAGCDATQEQRRAVARQQRAHFSDDCDRGDQGSIKTFEKSDGGRVLPFGPVGQRDQRPGVNEQSSHRVRDGNVCRGVRPDRLGPRNTR